MKKGSINGRQRRGVTKRMLAKLGAVATTVIGSSSTTVAAATSIDQLPQHEPQQQQQQQQQPNNLRKRRSLASSSYCGNGWQDAYDTCNRPCTSGKDEECGPGLYCYGYVACTPPPPEEDDPPAGDDGGSGVGDDAPRGTTNPWEDEIPGNTYTAPAPQPQPSVQSKPTLTANSPAYMPAYIASLPVRPSQPTTPAPFIIPPPTPNTLSNPTKNYCGYGWESAMKECYHACPSGKDEECPGGKTCHSWLTCTPTTVNPATYNVCGKNWGHASRTCGTRCFLGSDDTCPPGETCFGGVSECEDKLPELTAEDVGLVEKSYTEEEIKILLDEEIQRERDEDAMSDSRNWWCGSSWSNMLETCSKRCMSNEDCKPNAWSEGYCFKTTGGPDNCSTPGVPVKDPVPEGSRWCGSSWNNMLETCAKKCEVDEDCASNGGTCWEAPNTCQWIGVPVKEVSNPDTLWCGVDYDDAMTSCTKACPGETNEECPPGMSCFAGSSCTEEGVPVVREGYRCGTSWDDASKTCGAECQKNSDCNEDNSEQCFADVICESELLSLQSSGMFCGKTWEGTAKQCNERCEEDDDCPNGQWCYWVECENLDGSNSMLKGPITTEATLPSCDAEIRRCPNGQWVGKAPILNCDFYPCPEGDEDDVASDEDEAASGGEVQEMSASMLNADSANSVVNTDLSGWGSTPLAHACTSDSSGNCGLCEGDCNSDADCKVGLMCFSRGQGEMTIVPGCVSGGAGDIPGMDYCYTPFSPLTTTTTTSTTTTTTTTTTTEEVSQTANFMSAQEYTDLGYTVGTLDYARECTESNPCGACEGDCDIESHCAPGLSCFSRVAGSVELVPGCLGLGIAGMDYCHDPNAPLIVDPPTSSPIVPQGGCTAEIRACPNGQILYQDPNNNCQFPTCPGIVQQAAQAAAVVAPAPQGTSSPTMDSSTFYCGYNLDQVNAHCAYATPCPNGLDTECGGLEVCIRGTTCGGDTLSVATQSAVISTDDTALTELERCDALCVDVLPSEWCPEQTSDLNLPNCLEVDVGQLCESDGECELDDALNNCGTYDIYARVVCDGDNVSQGQLMRETMSPTPGPSTSPVVEPSRSPTIKPTVEPTTTKPTLSPVTNPPSGSPVVENNIVEQSAGVSISIADAIAANAASRTSSQEPSLPPATTNVNYESNNNAGASIAYDRNPGGVSGGDSNAAGTTSTYAVDNNNGASAESFTYSGNPGGVADDSAAGSYNNVYSYNGEQQQQPDAPWYNPGGGYNGNNYEQSSTPTQDTGGWNFDSYFKRPVGASNSARLAIGVSSVMSNWVAIALIIGMAII